MEEICSQFSIRAIQAVGPKNSVLKPVNCTEPAEYGRERIFSLESSKLMVLAMAKIASVHHGSSQSVIVIKKTSQSICKSRKALWCFGKIVPNEMHQQAKSLLRMWSAENS